MAATINNDRLGLGGWTEVRAAKGDKLDLSPAFDGVEQTEEVGLGAEPRHLSIKRSFSAHHQLPSVRDAGTFKVMIYARARLVLEFVGADKILLIVMGRIRVDVMQGII